MGYVESDNDPYDACNGDHVHPSRVRPRVEYSNNSIGYVF
jgi:hypothetical protein